VEYGRYRVPVKGDRGSMKKGTVAIIVCSLVVAPFYPSRNPLL
jgi:hypothetical protein